MIKHYYLLTKPGIIMGNLIAALGGFALASHGYINFSLFFATMLGIAFVIASACVFNNYMDRHTDKKMARTKERALAKGLISLRNATIFALILGFFSLVILFFFTNLLSVIIAICGFAIYVFWYSIWKYYTVHGTLIGSLAGAIPPIVGYSAVSNRLDMGTLILFLILVFWQMPHFYAISIYRFHEYEAACIPVLPIKKGIRVTKVQMLLYNIAFTIAAMMPTLWGYTGYVYLTIATILSFSWLILCIKGFKATNDKVWAHQMFRFSLLVITFLSIMIALDTNKNVSLFTY